MSELERKLKNGSMNRREMLSFLGKATGTIAGIGLGMNCKSTPTTPEPPKIGNLTIQEIKGFFTNNKITNVTAYLRRSKEGNKEHTTTMSNKTIRIEKILNPEEIRRIGLRSPNGVSKETDIQIREGENNIEKIGMIEKNYNGHHYEDYNTINLAGAKLNPNIDFKVYFYNKSVFEQQGNQIIPIPGLKIPLSYTASQAVS